MTDRVFPEPNLSHDWHCPVCRTRAVAPVVLVPKPGTERGNIVECEQVHQECYNLAIKMLELEKK